METPKDAALRVLTETGEFTPDQRAAIASAIAEAIQTDTAQKVARAQALLEENLKKTKDPSS